MKNFYIYDITSGIYLHEYLAQESPLEPGEYIKPVASTDLPPLDAVEGKVVCFNAAANAWEYRDDNRGTWYKPDGSTIEVEDFDAEIDPAWSRVQPAPTIDKLRADKSLEIDAACRESIYAGFISTALGADYHYPAKDKDQANLVGSVTESLYPNLPANWVTPFWCAVGDASGEWAYRPHTAVQIQQVGTDAKAAIVANLTKNAQLQAQIAVADEATLTSISW